MKIEYTDGNDERFNKLCYELDCYLNNAVGNDKQDKQYKFYIEQINEKMQIDEIKNMLGKSYWAGSRDVETIKKSIENSLCYGAFLNSNGKQVAFARVITDYATMYYICDVIVNEEYRGHSIGKKLVKTITEDTRLKNIKGMLLTADAHKLYEQFGFEKVEGKCMAKNV